jgi:hypothetical protein
MSTGAIIQDTYSLVCFHCDVVAIVQVTEPELFTDAAYTPALMQTASYKAASPVSPTSHFPGDTPSTMQTKT